MDNLSPYLRIPGKVELRLPLTGCGHPIIPAKDDMVVFEGDNYTVVNIEWDYDNGMIFVLAEAETKDNPKVDVEYHDDQTMKKVYNALHRTGLTPTQVMDAVNSIQNEGVLFREAGKLEDVVQGRV